MRKQYHLRPYGKGFNAWDIDKLLEATKDLPSCRSIGNHCKLIHEADLNYPIILSGE